MNGHSKRWAMGRGRGATAAPAAALGRDECIAFANARAVELMGVASDRLIGKPFIQFVHPDHRLRVRYKESGSAAFREREVACLIRQYCVEASPCERRARTHDKLGTHARVAEFVPQLTTWTITNRAFHQF